MQTHEASECVSSLVELFPQADLQTAELDAFRVGIYKFDATDVTDAMREHRLASRKNRPEFGAIFADLRERERRKQPGGATRSSPTFVQLLRQVNAHSALSDTELVLRYHRQQLHRSSRNEGSTAGALHRCRMDLMDCGLDAEQASTTAQVITEDASAFDLSMLSLRRSQPSATDVIEMVSW